MSKNRKAAVKPASKTRTSEQTTSNVVKMSTRNYKKIEIIPRSIAQEEYLELLNDDSKSIIFATGPAGTGKTMLAVLAAIRAYREGAVDKIIITRPAVGADDEKHGFLPGDLTQKLLPWCAPIMDIFKEYYSTFELNRMLEDEVLELAPIAFLRGRTFKNAFVIGDECQNTTINSMKMLTTRIGENSRMILTGDLNQHDRQFTKENGLKDFLERLKTAKSDRISVIEFSGKDIQRHPVVEEVLKLYKEI